MQKSLAQREELEKKVGVLSKQVEELRRAQASSESIVTATIQQKETENSALLNRTQLELDAEKSELDRVTKSLSAVRAENVEKQTAILAMGARVKTLELALVAAKQETAGKEKETEMKLAGLQREKTEWESKERSYKEHAEELTRSSQALERQLDDQRTERSRLEEQLDTLNLTQSAEYDKMAKQVGGISEEMEGLKRENMRLRQKAEKAERLKEQCKRLSVEMGEKDQKLLCYEKEQKRNASWVQDVEAKLDRTTQCLVELRAEKENERQLGRKGMALEAEELRGKIQQLKQRREIPAVFAPVKLNSNSSVDDEEESA